MSPDDLVVVHVYDRLRDSKGALRDAVALTLHSLWAFPEFQQSVSPLQRFTMVHGAVVEDLRDIFSIQVEFAFMLDLSGLR
jgi:hypothetical protein